MWGEAPEYGPASPGTWSREPSPRVPSRPSPCVCHVYHSILICLAMEGTLQKPHVPTPLLWWSREWWEVGHQGSQTVPSRSIPSKGEVEQMEGIHQTCTHQTLVGTLPCPRLDHGLVVTCHQEGCCHWHLLYQEVSLRRPWGGAGWYRLPQGGRPKCRRTRWQGGRGFCPVPCSGWSSTEHRMVPIPLGKEGGDCKGHVVEGQETRGQGHLIYRCQAGLSLGGAGAASPWAAISPRVHRTLPG